MYFTQEQVDTIQLPIRGKRLKLEVLNTDFQTLATLEGIAVGGSLQKDATAFVRRSGTIQMCVPNVASADTFIDYVEGITINVNGKIWLDKYVKVWTGIDNYNQPYGEEPKTVWYNFGICLIDQPVRAFSSAGYTMTFNLIDLSAKLNGDRAGQLAVTTTIFPRISGYDGNEKPIYTKTENALASCIEELTEFKKYTIYPIPEKWATLPYDIKIEVGGAIYSALEQFLNILNGWQMYFDNEGVFTVEPIPSGANDIVYPFNLQLNVSDTNSVDFNNVRNQVIVYGKSHNVQIIGNLTSEIVNYYEKAVITYQNLQLDKLYVGAILGFQQTFTPLFWFDNSDIQQMVTIKYTDSGGILHTLQTDIPVYKYGMDEIETSARRKRIYFAKDIYVIRIKDATTIENQDGTRTIDFSKPISLELLGRLQSQANIVNGNPESPYYINSPYTGKSHYAEFSSAVENTALNKLVLYYRITDKADDILSGDILTLTCPIPTKEYAQLELRVTGINIAGYVEGLVSNDYSNVGEDYTIWEFVFNGTNFVLKGRCPYSNPLILSGGEFDNIYADSLAEERAEYELFLHSNMQNTITLGCVPDYALDVNYRIKYNQSSALPHDAVIDESFADKYFITKQVTYPLGLDGTAQTVNAIEIYDDFNYVGYAYDLPTGT